MFPNNQILSVSTHRTLNNACVHLVVIERLRYDVKLLIICHNSNQGMSKVFLFKHKNKVGNVKYEATSLYPILMISYYEYMASCRCFITGLSYFALYY